MSTGRKPTIFKNEQNKKAILKNIFKDYVLEDMTIKEIAENYGYSERQIKYIVDHYIRINKKEYKKFKRKEKDSMENSNIIKVDDKNYMVDDRMARKSTIYDLVYKANLAKKEMKKKSTNKTVENNK